MDATTASISIPAARRIVCCLHLFFDSQIKPRHDQSTLDDLRLKDIGANVGVFSVLLYLTSPSLDNARLVVYWLSTLLV